MAVFTYYTWNDPPLLREGDAAASGIKFGVELDQPTTVPVSVEWRIVGDVDGADFPDARLPSGRLNFVSGDEYKEIVVKLGDDNLGELDETARLELFNPSSGSKIGFGAAAVRIVDDDAALPSPWSIDMPVSIKEGTSDRTFLEFNLSRPRTGQAETLEWRLVGGNNGIDGADFKGGQLPGGTLDFDFGDSTRTVRVELENDQLAELTEGIRLNVRSLTTGRRDYAETQLYDDDTTTLTLDASKFVKEGDSGSTAVTFDIVRTGDISAQTTADYALVKAVGDVNAQDFPGGKLPAGTVTFAPLQTKATIQIDVAGDTLYEQNEAFRVALSNPTGDAAISGLGATVLIQDDDPFPGLLSLAAEQLRKPEGAPDGTTAFTFVVTRSGAGAVGTSVDWAVTGGDADAGDFVGGKLPSGRLDFAAGETEKTITVEVAGDQRIEADEYFELTLSNPTAGARLDRFPAYGIVDNDDADPPVLAIAAGDADLAEGGVDDLTSFTFVVTRSGDASVAATADWAVVASGADPANARDFAGALPRGTVTFAPGERERTLTVEVAGDDVQEADETFQVVLANPGAGTELGASRADGVIRNDDVEPSVFSVSIANPEKAERTGSATSFVFTVTRDGPADAPADVDWAVSSETATVADFLGRTLPAGTLHFAEGVTSQTVVVRARGDGEVEADETFALTLANPTGGPQLGTAAATATILNDDSALSIAALDGNLAEGADGRTTAFTFQVTRAGDTSTAAAADWAVVAAGASADDFVGGALPEGTVSFAPGETAQTITIEVAGDELVEASEGFAVTLANPTGGVTLDVATATGTIRNDDVLGTSVVSVVDASDRTVAEGSDVATPVAFTVVRTGELQGAVTVAWAVGGDVDGADFVGGRLPGGTLSFAPGETSKDVSLAVLADAAPEGDELVRFTLSQTGPGRPDPLAEPGPKVEIGNASTFLTLLDDDAVPTVLAIAPADADKAEGNGGETPFRFVVSRTGDTSGTATVDWVLRFDGTNSADFPADAPLAGTVRFAAGEAAQTIEVAVKGDTANEGDEQFLVELTAPSSGVELGTATATGTIRNDDGAIVGTDKADTLTGTQRDDVLTGLAGDDVISGGRGNDILYGNAGSDTLDGGAGIDILNGGNGSDRFVIASADDAPPDGPRYEEIRAFARAAGDRIDLSAIDAERATEADEAFVFNGGGELTGAGQLRVERFEGDLLVTGSTDADAEAEFALVVSTSLTTLRASDFVL